MARFQVLYRSGLTAIVEAESAEAAGLAVPAVCERGSPLYDVSQLPDPPAPAAPDPPADPPGE